MFCYECGTPLYNGMLSCPYCNSNMDIVEELVMDNIAKELKFDESVYSFDRSLKETFIFGKYKVEIKGNRYIAAKTKMFVFGLCDYAIEDINMMLDSWTFDEIVKNGQKVTEKNLSIMAYNIIAYIKSAGCDWKNERLQDAIDRFTDASNIWNNEIYQCAIQFEDYRIEMEETINQMSYGNNGQWIGGGFGFKGAIKGAIEAQMLNAASGVLNGAGNAVKKSAAKLANMAQIKELKREFKESDEFYKLIYRAIYSKFNNLYEELTDCISEKYGLGSYQEELWEELENAEETEEETHNEENNDEETEKKSLIDIEETINMLESKPFDTHAYIDMYTYENSFGPELIRLATLCDVKNEVVKIMMGRDFRNGLINELPDEKSIGLGMDVKELEEDKKKIDRMINNNPAYLLRPYSEDYWTGKVYVVYKAIEKIYDLTIVMKKQTEVTEAVRKYSMRDVLCQLIADGDDVSIDIAYQYYLNKIIQESKYGDLSGYYKMSSELKALANTGNEVAEDLLAEFFVRNNENVEDNINKLINYAKQGHVHAMSFMGMCYQEGCKVSKNQDLARIYLIRAARRRSSLAMKYIGLFYMDGRFGFAKNKELAKKYLMLAEEQGEKSAKNELNKLQ